MKKVICSILFCLSVLCATAQDPTFSQFHSAPMNLNPSFAGSTGAGRVSLNYRNQWPEISGNYVDYNFGYDQYLRFLHGGLGLNCLYDVAGSAAILKTTKIDLIYAPHFQVWNDKIAIVPSVGFSYIEESVDWSKLTFGDQIDPQRGFVYNTNETNYIPNKKAFDLSSGLLVYTKRLSAGFSVYHITQPDMSLIGGNSPLPAKFTLHASYTIGHIDEGNVGWYLSPYFIYQKQQNFTEFIPGIGFGYKFINAGIACRTSDSFISTLGVRTKYFTLGYSYDRTISSLSNVTAGSHEVSLSVYLFRKHKPENFLKFPSWFF